MHKPAQLIIFDIYENNAYDIQQELKENVSGAESGGADRLRAEYEPDQLCVIETYRPDIVYHAAAHKHVPLMEDSPNEAIKNNVIGTYKTAKAAAPVRRQEVRADFHRQGGESDQHHGCVQASLRDGRTDDEPAEFEDGVCGSAFWKCAGQQRKRYSAVQKTDCRQDGPVTVTHPDIIRYFMTIPEAVSLVLQAGAYAKGGEIFVLDMGEPVKILDLAKNLIRLSGYRVG